MPTFILAGYARSVHSSVKEFFATWADEASDWKYLLVPGDKQREYGVSKSLAERVMELAHESAGAHVFAVTGRSKDRWEEIVRPYFRLRRVSVAAVASAGQKDTIALAEELSNAIAEENYWIEHVKPQDSNAALILPPIFSATRDIGDIWRLAESFNSARNLAAAADRCSQFTKEYRRPVEGKPKTPWVDEDEWVWDDSGARHGTPVFPEDWKYSFQLPDGFHYDVSSLKGTKTAFRDIRQVSHSFKKYLNVTAHGTVRGAAS